MRYDLIDLQGKLKIQGNTGSDSLGLGYSGSNVEWIESQLPGPTYSFLRNSGYNYFIVGATGTPQENAQGLLDVNGNISSIWTGSPAIDNRYTILLMPGQYDFANTPNELVPIEFTDYVGLSSNPYETILRNSLGGMVVNEPNGFDFGLENVYLPGDGYCYSDSTSYPRWKNVAFGGITFDVSTPWSDIRGEYTDILIDEGTNAFYSTSTIDGKFTNITSKSVESIFNAASSIAGTFSNISIGEITTDDSFTSTDTFSGTFENIEINNSSNTLFSSRQITGKFKNIKFKNVSTIFEPGATGIIEGYFENIQVDGATNVFYSLYSISGIFKKIKLKNITSSVLTCGSFNGEIDDFTVLQSSGSTILSTSTTDGTFKNIYVDSSSIFNSNIIFGTFSNINTNNTNCFVGDVATVTIKDSKFLGTFDSFLGTNTYLGFDVQNLIIGNVSDCFRTENLYGKIQDLEFQSCLNFCSSGVLISCTASNIYGKNVGGNFFNSTLGSIEGTLRNINIGDVGGNFFYADLGLNCDVYDVKAKNITGLAFSGGQIIGRKFRNITLGNCSTSVFNVLSFDSPDNYFENIEVGDVGGDFFISSGSLAIFDGTYQKIKAGAITGDFFKTSRAGSEGAVNIRGWYKDIEIVSCDEAFQVSTLLSNQLNNIRIENVKISSCGSIMKLCRVGTASVIRNLWVVGDWSPIQFCGSLENSFIDRSSSPFSEIPTLIASSVIKRSKILSIIEKPIYWNNEELKSIYLSEFNYIGNDDAPFYNVTYNIVDPDIE
jgi:hypothetical protein